MPALPPQLARRLDVLAREAHAFHRYAHHPLCGAYGSDVIQVRHRFWICRGCTYVAVGTLSGLALGAAVHMPVGAVFGSALVMLFASAYEIDETRPAKERSRLLPATALGLAVGAGLVAGTLPGLALALGGVGMFGFMAASYRKKGPDRSPCATCPEANCGDTCSGLKPIVRREQAYQRLSARIIAQSGAYDGLGRGQGNRTEAAGRRRYTF